MILAPIMLRCTINYRIMKNSLSNLHTHNLTVNMVSPESATPLACLSGLWIPRTSRGTLHGDMKSFSRLRKKEKFLPFVYLFDGVRNISILGLLPSLSPPFPGRLKKDLACKEAIRVMAAAVPTTTDPTMM